MREKAQSQFLVRDDLNTSGAVGVVDNMLKYNKSNFDKAMKAPSLYNITNYLSMGYNDSVKGAFKPEKPLSLKHWVDSAVVCNIIVWIERANKPHRSRRSKNCRYCG